MTPDPSLIFRGLIRFAAVKVARLPRTRYGVALGRWDVFVADLSRSETKLGKATVMVAWKRVRWRGWWTPLVRRIVSLDYGAVAYGPPKRTFASYW